MLDAIQPADGYLSATNAAAGARTQAAAFAATTSTQTSTSTTVDSGRYITPILAIDPKTHIAIYEERDPNTGKVLNQYPSEKVAEQYQIADQQSTNPLTDSKSSVQAPAANQSTATAPSAPAAVPSAATVQTAPASVSVDAADANASINAGADVTA